MTVISTLITKYGTVHATDSLITKPAEGTTVHEWDHECTNGHLPAGWHSRNTEVCISSAAAWRPPADWRACRCTNGVIPPDEVPKRRPGALSGVDI
jgi:hypothetical protein